MGKLTARKVETVGPGKYVDGDGLMLHVKPSGARSWVFRYQLNKHRHDMGLGRWPDVSLQKARERLRAARTLLADDIDPRTTRASVRLTFKDAAQELIESKSVGWKNDKHAAQWPATLKRYAFPHIGDKDVAAVDIEDVLTILKPIWSEKPETASRVRQRVESVLAFAAVKRARTGPNPAMWRGNLDTLLPAPGKVRAVKHHAAVPWRDIADVWKELGNKQGVAARAMRFLIATAARSSEVRHASWSEVDFETKVWTVPASRMKAGREHTVPLSDSTIELLGDPGEPDELLFPSIRGRPLSDVGLAKSLKAIVPGATAHGCRSTFRDWAGETTGHAREVIEHALAHQLKDRAEAAYARGTLFQKRRRLMDDWSAFLTGSKGGVVPIRRAS